MANFIDCWKLLKQKDFRHADKSEVLTKDDYNSINAQIKEYTDTGVDHVTAARSVLESHLGEADAQLKSIYEQTGIKTQAPPPVEPPPAAPPAEPPVTPTEPVPQKPSKIGQSIEAKAVEAKLTQGFAETAGYDPLTIKDQSQRATDLIKSSVPQARAIIRGEAPLPEGLRGTSLITAMEEHLLNKPDARVAYELANSPLTSATSAAAQEMRLMAERVPDGIAAKFTEIKRARSEGAKLRGETPGKINADISKEIVKQSSKRPTWEQFVREIIC